MPCLRVAIFKYADFAGPSGSALCLKWPILPGGLRVLPQSLMIAG